MASSGTYTWEMNWREIIEEAYERNGIQLDTLSGRQLLSARVSLNLLFRTWENLQIRLWAVEEESFATVDGTDAYTLDNTIDVLDVYIRRDGTDTELTRISRDEYALLPDKDEEAQPSQFFVERFKDLTRMTLWQVPDVSTDTVYYWRIREIEDVDGFRENPDAPRRWYEAICSGLAQKLALKKEPFDREKYKELKSEAIMQFGIAKAEDRERTPTSFQPIDYMRGF